MSGDEFKSSFALIDLLRRRRELQIDEVIELLASLPRQLDSDKTLQEVSLLRNMHVVFERQLESRELSNLMDLPIARWPKFKLSPRPPPDDLMADGERVGTLDETVAQRSAPTVLALLIYELLGGRQREGLATRLPPIAALGETANELLHRAVTRNTWRDAAAFWRDFTDARRRQEATRRELRMRTTSLAGLERGTVCKLAPLANETAPIHLIARPSFRIGRSAQQADFIARFSSQNPENAERTSELSRVHVLLELQDGGVKARDGDGVRPSRNGSAFEGVPLAVELPAPIGNGGVLSLGSHFRMKVIPMPAPKALRIVDAAGLNERDAFAPAALGAVAFEPLGEHSPPVQALWLLDAAGFRCDSRNGFVWSAAEAENASGLFLRRGGFFLLANISNGDARIVVDARALAPGEVVPLQSGQLLGVGDFTFAVALN